jgi:DNA-damage-inducible protein J
MSATDTYVRARIDTTTKERAADVLAAMGLSISDAIRLLMLRIADEGRLPFEVKVPNMTTRQAIAELEAGQVSVLTALMNWWRTYVRMIERSSAFKRDYKRETQGQHRTTFDADLLPDQPLAPRYRDHDLSGRWMEITAQDLVLAIKRDGLGW